MPSGLLPPQPPFVGRDRELRLLGALTRGSGGAAALICGDPGIGKSALLERVAAAAPGRVLRTRGVPAEAMVPFVALRDLLLPLHEYGEHLPAVQREALQVSLALRDGGPVGPLAVCAAALVTLTTAAEHEPLLLVVDDLQWVDPSSQQVLLFVARRLGVDRVVLLGALGDGPAPHVPDDIPMLRLDGLGVADSRELAAAVGAHLPARLREDIVERATGNPAALLAMLDERAPRRQVWAPVLEALPDAALTALHVVGESASGAVDEIEPVLAALGGSLADLAPAERSRLVELDGPTLRLRHPLLPPAVRARTPVAVRLRVHRAFAEHGSDRSRLRHLAASVAGHDETVAATLAAAAAAARARGAHRTAARVLGQAAGHTPDRDVRAERLLDAARDALVAGQAALAQGCVDEALGLRAAPCFVADAELVRCRALTALGHPERALDLVTRAVDAVRPHDPRRASRLCAEATHPALLAHRLGELVDNARRAEALGGDTPTAEVMVAGAVADALCGSVTSARARLDRAGASGEPSAGELLGPHRALAALALVWLEEHGEALSALGALLDEAHRHGAAATLSSVLVIRADLAWRTGHWAAAYADGLAALRWAEEVTQAGPIALALVALARLDAARGDLAACRTRVDRALSEAGPYGIAVLSVQIPAVLGLAALGAGEPAEAVHQLERAWAASETGGPAAPTVVSFEGDLVEALLRAGDVGRATSVLARLQARADASGLVFPAAVAARCNGLLAEDPEDACAAFATAAALHERRALPFERARTLLCHAEVLRRRRRPAAARPLLEEALAEFERLGARIWAARTASELAATGPSRSRACAGPVALDMLSPQEVHVARAVADGMNNAEVAAALYLSRKTVEAHLTRVYRKLGLRSRADLARVLARPADAEAVSPSSGSAAGATTGARPRSRWRYGP